MTISVVDARTTPTLCCHQVMPPGSPAQLAISTTEAPLPVGTRILVASFGSSGLLHLVRPVVFRDLVPKWLGNPTPWIVGSGLAELICSVGLLTRRKWAPTATAVTLAIIWVGNGEMALRLHRDPRASKTWRTAAWVRLPLQLPLIYWAWTSPTRETVALSREV
ncbi:MAG: hypothetical protein CMH41_04805 [Micrococcales bacterium]|nr:hypothetical protein [Micrococcales bacterium]